MTHIIKLYDEDIELLLADRKIRTDISAKCDCGNEMIIELQIEKDT